MTENKTEFQVNDIVKIRGGQAHWIVNKISLAYETAHVALGDLPTSGYAGCYRNFKFDELELVTKAKRKVKKWRWVYKFRRLEITEGYYTDAKEFFKDFSKENEIIQKLESTEIEVDE